MKIKEVISFLESNYPLSLQESYDNSGLILGNSDANIKSILLCIDITEDVINEAINKKSNLIISHHPIIFSGLKKIIYSNPESNIIIKAIKNNICLYAIHTNIDNSINGVNLSLAEKIGLKSLKILNPSENLLQKIITFCPEKHVQKVQDALFNAGAGSIGNYDSCSFNTTGYGTFRANEFANPFVGKKGKLHHENEVKIEAIMPSFLKNKVTSALINSHPYEEVAFDIIPLCNKFSQAGAGIYGELSCEILDVNFLEKIKKTINIKTIKHSKLTGIKIKKVGICGGSGSFLIDKAKEMQLDIFITGDIKYHDYFMATPKFIIADCGHFETEQFVKDILFTLLTKKFSTFAVLKSETNTNPVNYL